MVVDSIPHHVYLKRFGPLLRYDCLKKMVDDRHLENGNGNTTASSSRGDDSVAAASLKVSASNSSSKPKLLPAHNYCGDAMEVTITVLSLHGVLAKKCETKKTRISTQQKKDHRRPPMSTTTRLVASFCQTFATDGARSVLTHVPSSPIETSNMPSKPSLRPIVHWPRSMLDRRDDGGQEVLSTLRFAMRFDREDATSSQQQGRFAPIICPVKCSLARHGKLVPLGEASIIITGEETGESSMMIPIRRTYKRVKGRKSLRKKSSPHMMMKIKGDEMVFGLQDDAMVRVLVSVAKGKANEEQVGGNICDEYDDIACKEIFDEGEEGTHVVTKNGDGALIAERQSGDQSDNRLSVPGIDTALKRSESANSCTYIGDIEQSTVSRSPSLLALSDRNFVAEAKQALESGSQNIISGPSHDDLEQTSSSSKPTRPRRQRAMSTHAGASLFGEEAKTTLDPISKNDDDTLEDAVPDIFALDSATSSFEGANDSMDVNSVLSWCALTAILGSPAPSSVLKHEQKRETSLFCDEEEDDEVPDLPLDQDAPAVNWKEDTDSSFINDGARVDLNNTFDTASLSSNDDGDESEDASLNRDDSDHIEGFDHVPDIDDADSINEFIFADVNEYSTKDAADAALAWSALTIILSAPAPSAVSKLNSRSASKPNFDEEESSTELDGVLFPILEEQSSFGDESNDEMPSLAETDASLSPHRKKREYRYTESMDNDTMAQLEAMANRADQCPYCELLCCEQFPCSMRAAREKCQEQ